MITYGNHKIPTLRELTGLLEQLPDPKTHPHPAIQGTLNVGGDAVQLRFVKVGINPPTPEGEEPPVEILGTDGNPVMTKEAEENLVYAWVYGGGLVLTDQIL